MRLAVVQWPVRANAIPPARPWLEAQLFDTSARDPLVLVGVAVVLEAVALLARWIPLRAE